MQYGPTDTRENAEGLTVTLPAVVITDESDAPTQGAEELQVTSEGMIVNTDENNTPRQNILQRALPVINAAAGFTHNHQRVLAPVGIGATWVGSALTLASASLPVIAVSAIIATAFAAVLTE